jgi:NADPH2 dehydrogenase
VTDAVHDKRSYIFLQLWALGRAADPKVLEAEGFPYVSSSPTPLEDHPVPKELSKDDIKRYVGLYVQAAKNAVYKAGFDGVEIHSAKYVKMMMYYSCIWTNSLQWVPSRPVPSRYLQQAYG